MKKRARNKRTGGRREMTHIEATADTKWRCHLEGLRYDWNMMLVDEPCLSTGRLCPECRLSFLSVNREMNVRSPRALETVCGPCGVADGFEAPAPWWWYGRDSF